MTSFSTTGTGIIRLDTSRMNEYLKLEYYQPKLNFGQKLGRFFGKALSFLGPIGAAVTAVAVPGVGIPIAAGIYGLSSAAGKLTAYAESKDASATNALQQQLSRLPVSTPGLFEQASQAQIQSDFITPQEMIPQASITIVNRETAQNAAVENFSF